MEERGPDARRECGPENRRPRPSFSAALAILYFTLDFASDVYVFNIPHADTDARADASRSHLADHGPPPCFSRRPRERPSPRVRSPALPLISAQIRDPLSALVSLSLSPIRDLFSCSRCLRCSPRMPLTFPYLFRELAPFLARSLARSS